MADQSEVTHEKNASRFAMTVYGHLSIAEYELREGVMTMTHTLVPAELRGKGIAELLVRAALAEARASNYKVVPACSYVAKFMARHSEFADLLA